jgi:hypothetical protein
VQVTEAKTETRRKSSIVKTEEKVCKQNSLNKSYYSDNIQGILYILRIQRFAENDVAEFEYGQPEGLGVVRGNEALVTYSTY